MNTEKRQQTRTLFSPLTSIIKTKNLLKPLPKSFTLMAFPINLIQTLLFFFFFFFFSHLHLCLASSFTPTDNYLLNSGANTSTSFFSIRSFLSDSFNPGSSFLSTDRSVSVSDPNPSPDSPVLYHTARVFPTGGGSYKFKVTSKGTHFIRLHFAPFKASSFDLRSAKFRVLFNGFSVMNSFGASSVVVKEFVLKIDDPVLEVSFIPSKASGFGFVNAVEVFSAPTDFIIDHGTKLVIPNSAQIFSNLSSQVLETVHRINVGGSKLTPFNDTLWRTWVVDDDYVLLRAAAKRAWTTHSPNYQKGGATREIAPDNVYMTAQEMNRDNQELQARFNISWGFPVDSKQVLHLVRLHFCDVVSTSLNQLYFNVFINDHLAYKDVDLSTLNFHVLASPLYIDFVAESDRSGMLRISVGPSDLSNPSRVNALLNGVEIMRIVSPVTVSVKEGSGKRSVVWIVVGLVLGGFVFLSLLFLCVLCMCRRKNTKTRNSESTGWTPLRRFRGSSNSRTTERTISSSGYQTLRISFAELQSGTNNFDKSLVIGVGGFGMVFKGSLKDNTKVAVKRGSPGSRQGLPEFLSEITILSKIRHRHLVSLVGYCEEQSEMILVYEYMDKGPLKSHLYGSTNPPLSWKQRLEVCIGAARGLHYLHTGSSQGIIHRDIKSTNILLDNNYVAKVADFGLSRSGPCIDETHVSTGVKGSFGYLDPEYFRRQQLTDKSDVYSFGVVLFEVLCARPAVDPLLVREQVNLAEWAIEWQKKGMLDQIVDPNIADQIKPCSLKKFAETAEKCCADYGVDRPTIGDVLWNLEHVLQLQESGPLDKPEEVNGDDTGSGTARRGPYSGSNTERDSADDGTSGIISSSQVFSQLMTNAGR
ncbi:PREDICTED: probable receptor-like protein kinase At5g24010 [Camelina sativa]|uniref:Probable receptor-like protein kinase At5g24010 n=1 Tax=Camelina sativa TaxID=90675 RepID=A0ABM0T5L3_CAMSA|nr:PREDICTED: probable receptor-like protein kinase At5g24010 [Camelina sativa]